MKHLLLITLALAGLAIGQTSESITEKAAIAGTAVDAAADHILIQDGSVTAGQPVIKRLPIDELVDVPSLFGAVSKTELGYLDGVTSALQTQIDGKQATIADGGLTIAKTSGLQTALDGKAPTIVAPVAVASATARKTAATYTAAEVTPVNGLRVIQTDLPDVVWTLLSAADITADANWAGHPRTNAAGALPLSNVKVIDGNVPFSFSTYIPAASERWMESTATSYDAAVLFSGIKISGELMQAGNKVSITGSYRYFKSSGGLSSDAYITFAKKELFDHASENSDSVYLATEYLPRVNFSAATADVNGVGIFHAQYTLTEVTGATGQLYLVANTDFADGGATTSRDGVASYTTLAQPLTTSNINAPVANYAAGEDAEINIAIMGAANAQTKDWRIAITGGISFIAE